MKRLVAAILYTAILTLFTWILFEFLTGTKSNVDPYEEYIQNN